MACRGSDLMLMPKTVNAASVNNLNPSNLIRTATEHWHGIAPYSEITMTIHRSEREGSVASRIRIRLRMQKIETPGKCTKMIVNKIHFDVKLAPNLFTLSNLRTAHP